MPSGLHFSWSLEGAQGTGNHSQGGKVNQAKGLLLSLSSFKEGMKDGGTARGLPGEEAQVPCEVSNASSFCCVDE